MITFVVIFFGILTTTLNAQCYNNRVYASSVTADSEAWIWFTTYYASNMNDGNSDTMWISSTSGSSSWTRFYFSQSLHLERIWLRSGDRPITYYSIYDDDSTWITSAHHSSTSWWSTNIWFSEVYTTAIFIYFSSVSSGVSVTDVNFYGCWGVAPPPTPNPTWRPTTPWPTRLPTTSPTVQPTVVPTFFPSLQPTIRPTLGPSFRPTKMPTLSPSMHPTLAPSNPPTSVPTKVPSVGPSAHPTTVPSHSPTTMPTFSPSFGPTKMPTLSPSMNPTVAPSKPPSFVPTIVPSVGPSAQPTIVPSHSPTTMPSQRPTPKPTIIPSAGPTSFPTVKPTARPTIQPTTMPTLSPTRLPTIFPTLDFQIEWKIIVSGITELDVLVTRVPVAKTLGLAVDQVIVRNYQEYSLRRRNDEDVSNWEIEYALQSPTIEDAELIISNFDSILDIIELVLSLELEAELLNRTVQLELPDQNVTRIAWTDPPTMMPTLSPSKLPTLSPSRPLNLPPTKEPTNYPSTDPTRRPTLHPVQSPTLSPTPIPDIKAIKAEFDSSGLSINVRFDISTNQPGAPNAFDCGMLIDNDTVVRLGSTFDEGGARCEWRSKLLLVIYTGYGPTILPGHNITLLNMTQCNTMSICTEFNTYPMVTHVVTVTANSEPVQVLASLMGPAAIGECQDAKIQLTAAGGAGRELVNINWNIPDVLLHATSCNLTTNLDYLFLDKNCTSNAGMNDSKLIFSVNVSSWLESSDTAYFTTYYKASIIPDISLRGSKSIIADPLSGTEVAINVKLPDCADSSGYNFAFFWRQTLGIGNTPSFFGWDDLTQSQVNTKILSLGNAVTRKNLVIEGGRMLYDTYYTFQLSVTGDTFENNYNFVGIKTS